jgi:hypothetical protein
VKLAARDLIMPLIAAGVLVLTLQQTLGALRDSGSWRARPRTPRAVVEDPYIRVDQLFAKNRTAPSSDGMRNPFAFGGTHTAPVAADSGRRVVRVAPRPAAPAKPTLTSIIWDSDPRATVRYDGRDFSVRVNSLFADFRVKSITANQVTLDRNGETIVLGLRPKGE